MIFDDKKFKQNLHRVYIHKVKPVPLTYTKHEESRTERNSDIFYFVTYIEAAIDAYHSKLIRLSGLRRIMEEAVKDFQLIQWKVPPTATDSSSTAKLGTSSGGASSQPQSSPPPPSLPFPSLPFGNTSSSGYHDWTQSRPSGRLDIFSPKKSKTESSMKAAPPLKFSGGSRSLSASLPQGGSSAPSAAAAGTSAASNTSSLTAAGPAVPGHPSVSSPPPPLRVVVSAPGSKPLVVPSLPALCERISDNVKRELRTRELNRDILRGNAILMGEGQAPVDPIPFAPRRAIGCMINTVMGRGQVVAFRPTDGIFEVHVSWMSARNLLSAEAGVGLPRVKVYLPGSCIY